MLNTLTYRVKPEDIIVETQFKDLSVFMVSDHGVLLGKKNRTLAVGRRNLRGLGKYLMELADVWEGIPT